ncbi:MAG TPA: ParB/RepB/Spo0J family partition protein [Syntrophomonadaceae bacterium]|nr:ParB/RepB/Spo0J family partition protein [Syntrophomonadaceae bacterium]
MILAQGERRFIRIWPGRLCSVTRKERGLGRGLDALLSSVAGDDSNIVELDIDEIIPCRSQPRKQFSQSSLEELAASIREHGILQPVLVRQLDQEYELIAGERRWRAARIAGMRNIPALIKELDDMQVAEVGLIENLQREDLNIVEEAEAYRQMIERYQFTQEELAARIGKSRAHIANTMRLLNLPPEVVALLEEGKLSAGHARALLALESKEDQVQQAREIAAGKMSVRQVEKKIKEKRSGPKKRRELDPDLRLIQDKLEQYFGTRVEIQTRNKGGDIIINYADGEQLERLLELLDLA